MNNTPPESALASPLKQPASMRFFICMAFGRALGLPVADLLEAISIQMQAAKRAHASRPARLTDQERLRLGQLVAGWSRAMREAGEWMVKPESLIRWVKRYQHRQAQKREEWSRQPQRGRPPIKPKTVDAIVQIYRSGITGLKRIRGECAKCGISVARSTIRRVLDDHGLPPGPNRTGQSWLTFWRNHAPETVGIDFIQVATGLLGKVTYQFALIAIEHDTRRVHLLGITPHPDTDWLRNVVRSATMDGEPLSGRRFWIHDNDGAFTHLGSILQDRGLRSVRTVVGAPDMNAFAERFIRTAREECLDHIVFFSDDQLRRVLNTYIEHYNTERPHQGIGNVVIGPWEAKTDGKIVCDERLGGLLKSFRRAA